MLSTAIDCITSYVMESSNGVVGTREKRYELVKRYVYQGNVSVKLYDKEKDNIIGAIFAGVFVLLFIWLLADGC